MVAGLTSEDVQNQGGPRYNDIRASLIATLKQQPAATAADAFNRFTDEMRRPVDLLGLFQLSAVTTAIDRTVQSSEADEYQTVRPNGDIRKFEAPRLTYTDEDRAALLIDMDGGRP